MNNYLNQKLDQMFDWMDAHLPDCPVCAFMRGLWCGIATGAVLVWLV